MDLVLLREQVRRLLNEKLLPVVEECDLNSHFAMDAYQALADSGFGAIYLPTEYGGGDSLEGLCVVMEEMSRLSPGFALSAMSSFQLYGYNVARMGTPEQKERYLKPLIQNRKVGCWGLTEPERGSDAVGIQTMARKKGNDYILKGSKTFITNAPIADFFIIIANTGGEGIGAGSAFLLEKGMPGLSVSQPFKKFGHRSSPTGLVFLDDVCVPESNRLGAEGRGFIDMKHSLEVERMLVGPMVIGMLEALIEKCVTYAYSREQFGQQIIFYQMIQEKIAKMRMHLEIIKATTTAAVRGIHAGERVTDLVTALKLYAAQAATAMGLEAMQLHGGNGYMHEYGVEMFMRDAKLLEIGGGTNEMMLQILAKNTIKDIGRAKGVI